ncbi:CPBP family intramembrane glutamic endopeptidase [Amedibacillus sp. YH-ame6]
MFELFRKETKMLKETMNCKRNISVSAMVLVTLLILLCTEIVSALVMIFILALQGVESNSLDIILSNPTDSSQILQLFMTAIPIIGFLFASKHLFKRSRVSLGLTKEHLLRDYLKGLGIGFVMMSSVVLTAYFMNGLRFEGFNNFSIIVIFAYFIGFMVQGFNEELMLRGFFMNAIAARKTTVYAVLLNSILFALLHLLNDGISVIAFINLILAGVTFSLMALYHDNIIVCSAAHTIWNFAQGNLFGVLVSGMFLPTSVARFASVENLAFINGGNFGLEGGIAVSIVEIVTIGIYCYLYKRKNNHNCYDH